MSFLRKAVPTTMSQSGVMRIRAWPLRFEGELEAEFQGYYFETSLKHMRIAQFVGLLLYSSFGILDAYLVATRRDRRSFQLAPASPARELVSSFSPINS